MNKSALLMPRLIRASAGTGKTRDLSSRYIGLMALGESPDRILATTFTKKAAGEIRERVFSRLAAAASSEECANELGECFGEPQFTSSQALSLLTRLVKDQHRLLITTLDGLFISITRSFALELGLPAGWRIASTRDSELLREEAVRDLFEKNPRAVALELVRAIHGGSFSRSVHGRIVSDVSSLYHHFLFAGSEAFHWLEIPVAPSEDQYQRFVDALDAVDVPLTKDGKPSVRWLTPLTQLRKIVRRQDWQELLGNGLVKAILEKGGSYYSQPIPAPLVALLNWFVTQAAREVRLRIKLQLGALFTMLTQYHESYQQTQQRLSVLSFDDVKQHLARSALFGQLDEVYFRLDSRINHLLLDEFQDTSITEWRVLKPFVDEILSKEEGLSFFCVGDIKQAIYGWRGGESQIFASMEETWPQLRTETKQTTYRCSPALIKFVNHLFTALPTLPCLIPFSNSVREWCSRFEPHHAARQELEGCVDVRVVDREKESISEAVVALVQRLHRQRPQASIGILLRKNASVADIIDAFSLSPEHLEVSEEGGNPLIDAKAVQVLLSLLQFLDHPGDSLSAFHVEQSDVAKLLDVPDLSDTQRIDSWQIETHARLLTVGYGPVIAEWARELEALFSPRECARLNQFVDLAYRYDASRPLATDDFITFVKSEKVEFPSKAAIRAMTIHQAKGLEFDIVILPQLEESFKSPSGVFTERPAPLATPSKIAPSVLKWERQIVPELERMYQSQYAQSISESLSVLYVAVTRARHAMYLVVPDDLSETRLSLAKIVQQAYFSDDNFKNGIIEGVEGWEIMAESHIPTSKYCKKTDIKPVFSPLSVSGRRSVQRVSPSRISQTGISAARADAGSDSFAQLRGIALHALLEQIEWIEGYVPDLKEALALCKRCGMSSAQAEQTTANFQSLLQCEGVVQVLSRSRYSPGNEITMFRERRFGYYAAGSLVTGAFDRLVIESFQGQDIVAEVIDFKSGNREAGSEVKSDLYRQQLEHYCYAARQLVSAETQVKGFLLYVNSGELVQVI